MKKIFKKSLAIMVSAAICLTALIGCLSVSAATRGEGTFTVGSDSGKPGASVTVPIELEYTSGGEGMGIAASLFDVSFDTDALTITDIAAGEDAKYDPGVEDFPGGGDVPPQDIYTVEYRSNGETISVVDDAVRILAMPAYNETVPADSETVLTSMTVNLTFTIKEGAAAQDYDIKITEQQTCDYGQAAPDEFDGFTYAGNEEFINMTIANGKVTVSAAGPVLDENIDLSGSYASISAEINLVIVLNKATITADYAEYELEIVRNTFNNQYMYQKLTDELTEADTSYGTRYYYVYAGIGMYEMNLPITVTAKALDAEGNVVAYNTVEFNIVDMLKTVYNNASTSATMKATIVDLLYLGTEAQKYFGKDGTDLAAVAFPTDGFDVESTTEFNPDELSTVESVDPEEAYADADCSLNLNIAKNPGVYYIISGIADLDASKVTVEATYTNGLNGEEVTDVKSITDPSIPSFAGKYYYVFNQIAFYDLDKTVKMTVKYNGKPVLTTEFAVETYISKNYPNETQGDLLVAMAKFSKSARINFIG